MQITHDLSLNSFGGFPPSTCTGGCYAFKTNKNCNIYYSFPKRPLDTRRNHLFSMLNYLHEPKLCKTYHAGLIFLLHGSLSETVIGERPVCSKGSSSNTALAQEYSGQTPPPLSLAPPARHAPQLPSSPKRPTPPQPGLPSWH